MITAGAPTKIIAVWECSSRHRVKPIPRDKSEKMDRTKWIRKTDKNVVNETLTSYSEESAVLKFRKKNRHVFEFLFAWARTPAIDLSIETWNLVTPARH